MNIIKTLKAPLSINIIYWLPQEIFGLFKIVCGGAVSLILWIFIIMYANKVSNEAKHIEFKHVEIAEDFPNFAGLLMAALFIWVLSHIFMSDVKLQDEQNLTE